MEGDIGHMPSAMVGHIPTFKSWPWLLFLLLQNQLTQLYLDARSVTNIPAPAAPASTNKDPLSSTILHLKKPFCFHLLLQNHLTQLHLDARSIRTQPPAAAAAPALNKCPPEFLLLLLFLQNRLTQLHLDARSITDSALLLLRPLAHTLKELDLHGARITPRGAAALKPFTALQRLDLCGAFLTGRF